MNNKIEGLYVRRTQKDYSLEFKLSVVWEVESGSIGVRGAMRKYGTFDKDYQIGTTMSKTPQQKLFDLEQKVRLLEKEKSFLEQDMINASDKANNLDTIVELAEQEYNIRIRKKFSPGQSGSITKNAKKR